MEFVEGREDHMTNQGSALMLGMLAEMTDSTDLVEYTSIMNRDFFSDQLEQVTAYFEIIWYVARRSEFRLLGKPRTFEHGLGPVDLSRSPPANFHNYLGPSDSSRNIHTIFGICSVLCLTS